jgi:hypothetical protein
MTQCGKQIEGSLNHSRCAEGHLTVDRLGSETERTWWMVNRFLILSETERAWWMVNRTFTWCEVDDVVDGYPDVQALLRRAWAWPTAAARGPIWPGRKEVSPGRLFSRFADRKAVDDPVIRAKSLFHHPDGLMSRKCTFQPAMGKRMTDRLGVCGAACPGMSGRSGVHMDVERIFSVKVQVYGTVEFNSDSVLVSILKIACKALIEVVRQATLTPRRYTQVQVGKHATRHLSRALWAQSQGPQ